MTVSLKLLGAPSVSGQPGAGGGWALQRRRLALLALLAAAGRGGMSRDKLIAHLWPERDAEGARRLLSELLYETRRALGGDVVLADGDDLRLSNSAITTDVGEFEAAVEHGELERAVALYAGPFLDGVHLGGDAAEFDRWAEAERGRLAQRFAAALERLAEQCGARGDARGAVDAWRRLAALNPYAGRTALGLMRALDRAGDRAGAIQHARVHTTLLREELEAEPDSELLALALRLRAAPVAPPPAPASRQAASSVAPPSTAREEQGARTADPAAPGLRALSERYAVERLVEDGKVVSTYAARDSRDGREVSLHVVNPRIAGIAGVDHFLRVFERVAALADPRIVPVSDFGAAGDVLYCAAPRPEGRTLRERLTRERPLPVGEAVRFARDVATALEHAHACGVRHGDLRPKYVVLTREGALLAGLGFVEALGAFGGGGPDGTGVTIGAPAYLSPEQLTGEGHPDERSDVYSLGCVLYEMLAGELPFGSDRFSSINRKLTQPPPSVRALRESVPEAIDRVVRACLARMPADRFQSAEALRAALEKASEVV